jgi:hypothetical protein
MFALVFSLIITTVIKEIAKQSKNNHSPVVPVNARIIGKRINVNNHLKSGNLANHYNSTTYFVTFEFENAERMELAVPGEDYGLLLESDFGILTFQGTRFIGFRRIINR